PGEGEESKWRRRAPSESAQISDLHLKQPARRHTKDHKAPPPLFSQGAGSTGHFHPLAHEGECSLTKRGGSGAPKGAGNIDTPCGARPCEGRSPRGAPLRRVSLDLETAF